MIQKFDLSDIAVNSHMSLLDACGELQELYEQVDHHMESAISRHKSPCHAGCSACCCEAVFLTPLEMWFIIHHLQTTNHMNILENAIEQAHHIYDQYKEIIDQFQKSPPPGEHDHFKLAKDLRYPCPFLDKDTCSIYPARGLVARLFGNSFERPGVVFGCTLCEAQWANEEISLPNAAHWMEALKQLPLTHARQVIPYYLVTLYKP